MLITRILCKLSSILVSLVPDAPMHFNSGTKRGNALPNALCGGRWHNHGHGNAHVLSCIRDGIASVASR